MIKKIIVLAVILVIIMFAFDGILPDAKGKTTTDKLSLAQTIFGEARGEPWSAKLAVGHVVINRKRTKRKYFGLTIRTIVRKPNQFTCWSRNDVNFKKIHRPLLYANVDVWLECYVAALLILRGKSNDNTGGAMWYFDDSLLDNPPSWAAKLEKCARHGKFTFFREKK